MDTKLLLGVLLASASAIPADASGPTPAGYGFNWLDPQDECKAITDKELPPGTKCEASDNAFGLDIKSRTCKVSAKVEWVVYDTAAQCQEAWETMQANGD